MKTTKTKVEIINEINHKYNKSYKISGNGRIYDEFMGKKLYFSQTELIKKWEIFEKKKFARENVNKVNYFMETLNCQRKHTSMYGSAYYEYKGYNIRVSDHDWTSIENHPKIHFNFCSYEQKGYVEIINKIKSIF